MSDLSKLRALWAYYGAVAAKLGTKEGSAREEKYSVRWYFDGHGPDFNTLTRAFLGEETALRLVRKGIRCPGDAELQRALYGGSLSADFSEEDLLEADSHNPPPDPAQTEAIKAALSMPVSFIKGPPGSGKTSGILHLLSCILRRGKTAAMVSSNNTAIASIEEKLAGFTDPSQKKQQALKAAFARLGSSAYRRAFEKDHPELFSGAYGSCAAMPAEVFLASFPIVASTLNSLPRCFGDWAGGAEGERAEPKYDYVIVDEASQVSAVLGLMAMGSARHLVLVGDDDQLPPVFNEKLMKRCAAAGDDARKVLGDAFDQVYALAEGRSFLSACREVFLRGQEGIAENCDKMLRYHYRCHPGIIGFCRDAVYTGDTPERTMQIRTRQYDASHPTPIRVLWFEGKFSEECSREGPGGAREKRSRRNRRQAEIFMGQEWPELLERLCADPGTVLDLSDPKPLSFCVLSPFRGQLWTLRDMLEAWLSEEENRRAVAEKARAHRDEYLRALSALGLEAYLAEDSGRGELRRELALQGGSGDEKLAYVVDRLIESLPDRLRPYIPGEDRGSDPMEVRLPELTIHKVQGQEYDIVYFLPVEDASWERPWSQKKRLINVAVSRAKKELRIIVSTALMDPEIQRALTGGRWVEPWAREDGGEEETEDDRFLQKLIAYVWARGPEGPGPWTDGPFGFIRAGTRSLFDGAVYVGRERAYSSGKKKPYPSAPEVHFQNWLTALPFVWERKLRVYTNAPISAIVPPPEGLEPELTEYIGNGAHFDFVVCLGQRVLLACEVDGSHHRTDTYNQACDRKKDQVVAQGFRAAMYRASGGGLVPMEGSGGEDGTGFDFLRLPTDGSAWDEERLIPDLLRRRLRNLGGQAYTLPTRPLDDLPEELRAGVFTKLSRPQNWKTGRPVRPGGSRKNVRWVPTEPGTKSGLMLAYLPGSVSLYPTLVCTASK